MVRTQNKIWTILETNSSSFHYYLIWKCARTSISKLSWTFGNGGNKFLKIVSKHVVQIWDHMVVSVDPTDCAIIHYIVLRYKSLKIVGSTFSS